MSQSSTDQRIFTAIARLDDGAAMAQFLAPIPNSGQLAEVLATSGAVSTRAYDDESRTARFVSSDGAVAMCFTVTDITIDQAEMIATECDALLEWSNDAFRKAVARALGADFEPPSNTEPGSLP